MSLVPFWITIKSWLRLGGLPEVENLKLFSKKLLLVKCWWAMRRWVVLSCSVLLMELMSGGHWFVTRCLVLYGFDEQLAQQEVAKVHFISVCCVTELKHESQDACGCLKPLLGRPNRCFQCYHPRFPGTAFSRARQRGNYFFLASFLICSKPICEWCR